MLIFVGLDFGFLDIIFYYRQGPLHDSPNQRCQDHNGMVILEYLRRLVFMIDHRRKEARLIYTENRI